MTFSFPLYGIHGHVLSFLLIWYFYWRTGNELGFYCRPLLTQWKHWAPIVTDSCFSLSNFHTYSAFLLYVFPEKALRTHVWFHFPKVLAPKVFSSAQSHQQKQNKRWSVWRRASPQDTLLTFQKGVMQGEGQDRTVQGPSNQRAWPGWAGLGWAGLGRMLQWLKLPKGNNFHVIRGATLARGSRLLPLCPERLWGDLKCWPRVLALQALPLELWGSMP